MSKTKYITYTALCIALLVAVQFFSKALGQIVTGSLVNFILAASTLIIGTWCGAAVAAVSPFAAFLFGIGTPIFPLVPMIAAGNAVLILIYAAVFKLKKLKEYYKWGISVPAAALCKFTFLYFGVVKLVLPIINMPSKQAAAISITFGAMQFITAAVGGTLAFLTVPALKKAVHNP